MNNRFNLFGDIVASDGDKWFESDVTPSLIVNWLSKQEGDVEININSNGGDVTAGLAIANAIRAYSKGEVHCNVLGLAASMASVIACAGTTLTMGQGAFLMIHNPWTIAAGDADALKAQAEVLEKMKASLLSFYVSKFEKTEEELSALMDAETWIPFESAGEFGLKADLFADESLKAAASLTRRGFEGAPDAARAFFAVKPRTLEPKAEEVATPMEAPAPTEENVKPEEIEAVISETATEAPHEEAAVEAPAPTEEPKAEEVKAEASLVDWEARFKGLSKKMNEVQAAHEAALKDCAAKYEARLAELTEAHAKELEDFKAQLKEHEAKLGEVESSLNSRSAELDEAKQNLVAKDEQIAALENARTLLTGGVLSPDAAPSYEAELANARTAKEREAIRKRAKAKK